ncbi:sensor domain-containing diguanylate cyclase [Paraburkholderia caribensis]|uniref:sensor domain-containing diguanylate cyclase n=1 Tax=Paraburkholderia caribensis TaxID=75105 RepID=UPI001D07E41C|nr:sensor domain-containing diguanylate cyclase [Paraburkholderia caribensis]
MKNTASVTRSLTGRLRTFAQCSRPRGHGKAPHRAFILLPALTVLILAVLWVTILMRLRVEKAAVLHDARVAAGTVASALDTHTLKTIHDVDTIALLVKYGYESSPDTFDLKKYQAYGLITADTALQVTLAGADGHVIASTIPFSGAIDLSDRKHFRVHRERPDVGLFLSEPLIGRISRQWSIQATRRINRPDGGFGGVVIVSENPAWLTDGFYTSAALGEHGMIAVLSDRGSMLSRRAGGAPSRTGESLPTGYVDPRGNDDMFTDPIDRVERIVARREVKRYGLTVMAGLSVAETLDDYYRMRRVYVTMASVISAILVGLSTWIAALILKLLKGRAQLHRLAHTDRLTGLSNRGCIMDRLEEAVAAPDAAGRVAVIFVDLDRFKELNDTFGHHLGDTILADIARRLMEVAQGRAQVGRLGGDEFLLVIEDGAALAPQVADAITAALEAPVSVHGNAYRVCASLGIAVLQPGERAEDLVKSADRVMYDAKELGRANRAPRAKNALVA